MRGQTILVLCLCRPTSQGNRRRHRRKIRVVFVLGDEMELTSEELSMVLESLQYTLRAFENTAIAPWGPYPSYEFKRKRIKEVEDLIAKIRSGNGISRGG